MAGAKHVSTAAAAALIYGIVAAFIGVISYIGTRDLMEWSPYCLSVAMLWGLGFGVYKKNRLCAVLLLMFWSVVAFRSWWVHRGSFDALANLGLVLVLGVPFLIGVFESFGHKVE